jgi:hypothetical protein
MMRNGTTQLTQLRRMQNKLSVGSRHGSLSLRPKDPHFQGQSAAQQKEKGTCTMHALVSNKVNIEHMTLCLRCAYSLISTSPVKIFPNNIKNVNKQHQILSHARLGPHQCICLSSSSSHDGASVLRTPLNDALPPHCTRWHHSSA